MSDRLATIEARTDTVRELQSVIAAMRGVAAARAREAQQRLPGIRASAAALGAAIGDVLSVDASAAGFEPRAVAADADRGRIVIVICSEQGFVGAYNTQIVERAKRCAPDGARAYLMVGSRGVPLAQAEQMPIAWTAPMAAHADDIVPLANRITDALYAHLEAAGTASVSIVHATPGASQTLAIVEHRLLPFDYARFDATPRAQPPLLNLPPAALLADLAQSYVFVELCEAAMLAYAAENEARTRAMIAARESVQRTLDGLLQTYRIARQDEITSDILELAAGGGAVGGSV